MSLPYIGSTITLISKAENRYVGKLAQIDQQASTVTLQSVRSFGTEGRRPGAEIPPSDQVFEYIVFRGSDIKDLHVSDFQPPPAPAKQPVLNDPAIVSQAKAPAASVPKPAAPKAPAASQPQSQKSTAASGNVWNKIPNVKSGAQQSQQQQQHKSQDKNQQKSLQANKGPAKPAGKKIEIPTTDFDFETANARLDKKQLENHVGDANGSNADGKDDELMKKLEQIKLETYYDKKTSFFDNISSDIKDRWDSKDQPAEILDRKKLREQDRNQNLETFGVANVRRGRGGYRGGRGRGGRGRGRGRGGRSYQNNNQIDAPAN